MLQGLECSNGAKDTWVLCLVVSPIPARMTWRLSLNPLIFLPSYPDRSIKLRDLKGV